MINTIVKISEIVYDPSTPSQELVDSIAKRGIAIPVKVNRTDNGYECVDGRKRLTACSILLEKYPSLERIPVMLMNDFSKSGSSFWGNTQNHH